MNRIDRSHRTLSESNFDQSQNNMASINSGSQSSADIFAEIELSLDNFRTRAEMLRKGREEQFAAASKAMEDISNRIEVSVTENTNQNDAGTRKPEENSGMEEAAAALKENFVAEEAESAEPEERSCTDKAKSAEPEEKSCTDKAESAEPGERSCTDKAESTEPGEKSCIDKAESAEPGERSCTDKAESAEPEEDACTEETEISSQDENPQADNAEVFKSENDPRPEETEPQRFQLPDSAAFHLSSPVPDSVAHIMDILTVQMPAGKPSENRDMNITSDSQNLSSETNNVSKKSEYESGGSAENAVILSAISDIKSAQAQISSEMLNLSKKLDSVKSDLSEKIHKESLSSYRNIQELFKEEAAARKNYQEDLKKLQKIPALAKAGLVLAAINTGIIALLVMSI